jgi:hypothetical protein
MPTQLATMDGSHNTNGGGAANAGTKGRFPACSIEPATCARHKVMYAAKACRAIYYKRLIDVPG